MTFLSVIIDCYATTKVLKKIADDASMLTSAHVVNVINFVTKSYTNTQIFYLVPLQTVYAQEEGLTKHQPTFKKIAVHTFFAQSVRIKLASPQAAQLNKHFSRNICSDAPL